jgi:thiol peroxidase
MERAGAVTMKGNPLTLLEEGLAVGQKAPSFTVLSNDMKETSSDDFKEKIKLIASVPSLDTPICDLEIKRFNDEASKLSKDLIIIFVSMDLPFAQKRFCHDNNIKKVKTFSDYRDADFGRKYGVLIKELRLLARAIFIIDSGDTVRYVEYVSELTSHPNYEAALQALKGVVG